jgi:bifunctional DNase/RNase
MPSAATVEVSVLKVAPLLREDRPLLWLVEKSGEPGRLLGIAIGEFEAAAIQMPLDGDAPVRPISYDLLVRMLPPLGVTVTQVVIHGTEGTTYLARLVFQCGEQIREVDARPSDAVAIALRLGVPIFVTADLLDRLGLVPLPTDVDPEQTLARFLEPEMQVEPRPPQAAGEAAAKAPTGSADARLPAATSVGAPTSAMQPVADELTLLQSELERAVVCEEYEEAARLRDAIEALASRRRG